MRNVRERVFGNTTFDYMSQCPLTWVSNRADITEGRPMALVISTGAPWPHLQNPISCGSPIRQQMRNDLLSPWIKCKAGVWAGSETTLKPSCGSGKSSKWPKYSAEITLLLWSPQWTEPIWDANMEPPAIHHFQRCKRSRLDKEFIRAKGSVWTGKTATPCTTNQRHVDTQANYAPGLLFSEDFGLVEGSPLGLSNSTAVWRPDCFYFFRSMMNFQEHTANFLEHLLSKVLRLPQPIWLCFPEQLPPTTWQPYPVKKC